MKKEFTAWAIDTLSDEGHGYLGRYYFTHDIPPSSEGCELALFKTRAIARTFLYEMQKKGYNSFPKARVVKVKISVISLAAEKEGEE